MGFGKAIAFLMLCRVEAVISIERVSDVVITFSDAPYQFE